MDQELQIDENIITTEVHFALVLEGGAAMTFGFGEPNMFALTIPGVDCGIVGACALLGTNIASSIDVNQIGNIALKFCKEVYADRKDDIETKGKYKCTMQATNLRVSFGFFKGRGNQGLLKEVVTENMQ